MHTNRNDANLYYRDVGILLHPLANVHRVVVTAVACVWPINIIKSSHKKVEAHAGNSAKLHLPSTNICVSIVRSYTWQYLSENDCVRYLFVVTEEYCNNDGFLFCQHAKLLLDR